MSIKRVWTFIVVVILIIACVDVYLYNDDVPRNSISQVIIDASKKSSLIPAMVGFVMGALAFHWFDDYAQTQ